MSVSLPIAIHQVEAHYHGWYYCPARWHTADGTVPYHLFWLYWSAMTSHFALQELSMARAIGLALAGDEASTRRLQQQAFPDRPNHG